MLVRIICLLGIFILAGWLIGDDNTATCQSFEQILEVIKREEDKKRGGEVL